MNVPAFSGQAFCSSRVELPNNLLLMQTLQQSPGRSAGQEIENVAFQYTAYCRNGECRSPCISAYGADGITSKESGMKRTVKMDQYSNDLGAKRDHPRNLRSYAYHPMRHGKYSLYWHIVLSGPAPHHNSKYNDNLNTLRFAVCTHGNPWFYWLKKSLPRKNESCARPFCYNEASSISAKCFQTPCTPILPPYLFENQGHNQYIDCTQLVEMIVTEESGIT